MMNETLGDNVKFIFSAPHVDIVTEAMLEVCTVIK
jgi:hypothetical protein